MPPSRRQVRQALADAAPLFANLARRVTIVFFCIGGIEMFSASFALLLNGIDHPNTKSLALFLELIATFFAAVILIVPLDASRKWFARASETCAYYAYSDEYPTKYELQCLLKVPVTWISNPLANTMPAVSEMAIPPHVYPHTSQELGAV